jgi:hypothetical protein
MREVLVIHSTSDLAVDDRITAMAKKPELAGCHLSHAYFILPQDGPAMRDIKPGEFLKQNRGRIVERFAKQIEETKSELVVLHSGIAFWMAPQTVLDIFMILRRRFPDLKFGIQDNSLRTSVIEEQGRLFQHEIEQLFDFSSETTDLIKLMF